ncbi:HpcH/HpaI aldolase family protein [Elioraea rosea]|uniref:HpcH/HpaI aldolase family protein n=1 Tax=Elioraea rosea TaxID=2492390 RepID=UPI001EF46641|nr:aldolase/citrate lyase family protein [Elioraea rosea]
MAIVPNHAKDRMKAGGLALGLGLHHLRTTASGMLGEAAGFDWLFIDAEHGAFSEDQATQIALAALPTGCTPIVRVCKGALDQAPRVLDNGAMGVVIPHVDTAEEANEVVAACKYPPVGHRSLGGPPAQARFAVMPAGELMAKLNEQLLTIVMIETPRAVENAEAIAAVPGIDVLLIGTSDLTAEMGIPGQLGNAKVKAAYESVIAACRKHGKFPGMGGVYDEENAGTYIGMGMQFILSGSDHGLLMPAMKSRTGFLRGLNKA